MGSVEELLAKDYEAEEDGGGTTIQTDPMEVQKRRAVDMLATDYAPILEEKAQKASEIESRSAFSFNDLPVDSAMYQVEGKGPVQALVDYGISKDATGLLKKTDSTLGRLFNLYQRGQYGIAGAAVAMAKGESPLTGAYEGFVEGVPASWIDYMNLIAERNIEGELPRFAKAANFGIGMTLDFVTDPIQYCTPGAGAKLYDLLGMGRVFQALEKFPSGQNLLAAGRLVKGGITTAKDFMHGIPVIQKSEKKMRDLFQEYGALHGLTGAKEVFKEHGLAQENITRYVLNEVEDRLDTFVGIAKDLGFKDPEGVLKNSFHWYQTGRQWAINPDLWKHLEKDTHWLDDLFAKDVQAGLLSPSDYVDNYLPHIVKETESGKYFGGTMGYKNPGSVFYTKPKVYENVEEFQQALDRWATKGWMPDEKQFAAVDNWYEALGVRAWVGEMAREQMRFTTELMDRFGLPVSSIDQFLQHQKGLGEMDPGFDLSRTGWVAVVPSANLRKHYGKTLQSKMLHESLGETIDPGLLETLEQRGGSTLVPILTGGVPIDKVNPIRLDEEAVKRLGKNTRILPLEVYQAFKDPGSIYLRPQVLQKAWQGFQTGMQWWKTMATSLRLPFHARNYIGNQASLIMAGMDPFEITKYNGKSAALQMGRGEFYGMPAKEFLEMADRVGTRGYGFQGADIPSRFSEELAKKLDIRALPDRTADWGVIDTLVKEPTKALATKARAFGALLEDNSRLSLLMREMDRMGAQDLIGQPARLEELVARGTETVNHYLHDYTALSKFERAVAKPIWPFYTFMRKNLARHLEALYQNPAYYSRLAKYREALYPLVFGNPPETETERYVKSQQDEDMRIHKTRWTTENGNPVYAYVDIPAEQLRMLESPAEFLRSTNPIFAIGEVLANTSHWPKPRPIDDGRRVPAPFWMNWLGGPEDKEKWSSLANYGPMIDQNTKKVVMGMSPQWKEGIEQTFPFLREWSQMFPQPNSVMIEDQGKWKALNYITGLRFTPMDIEKGMRIRKIQRNEYAPPGKPFGGERRKLQRNLGRGLTEEEDTELRRKIFR